MEEYIIYIKMPSYLAQWFVHEHGGSPVRLKKGSAESLILQLYLTKPPSDYVPKQQQPDEVAIIIPEFKLKDPASYFYLSKKAVPSSLRLYTRDLWCSCSMTFIV